MKRQLIIISIIFAGITLLSPISTAQEPAKPQRETEKDTIKDTIIKDKILTNLIIKFGHVFTEEDKENPKWKEQH